VIVAAPVVGRSFRIVGTGRSAAYGEDDGFIAVLTLEPPLLPNGLQVARLPSVGEEVVAGGEVWDPTLRVVAADLVADGPEDLVDAVVSRDPERAALAGRRLIGRGGGLTPEGDDLVAGVAAVVASSPWPGALREAWLGALVGDDLRRRTTALSATLLELAVRGMGPEPLQAVVAGDAGALSRLLALGHSTGPAYARGAAVGLLGVAMRRLSTPHLDV
jgi:Protein of unknown function (DUF2877)